MVREKRGLAPGTKTAVGKTARCVYQGGIASPARRAALSLSIAATMRAHAHAAGGQLRPSARAATEAARQY